MLDFVKIKTDLESSFNSDMADGVDVSINVNVINEENGKFSVSVLDNKCTVYDDNLSKAYKIIRNEDLYSSEYLFDVMTTYQIQNKIEDFNF